MRKKIALVTGGFSGEAVVSYQSAEAIVTHVDADKWEVYTIDITTEGWFYKGENEERSSVNKADFSITENGKKVNFDAALIALHGTPGEDGKLQGYFDCVGVKYASCNTTCSAVTFNKQYTVAIAAHAGVPVAKSMILRSDEVYPLQKIQEKLSLPYFVKPNRGGSSLGMSKVDEDAALKAAITKAFEVDDQVLVEEFIEGREFTIGVYECKGKVIPLPITEIISENAFFDFEAKYLGASEEITPAQVEESVSNSIRESAVKIYRAFNCSGLVRVDFIYSTANQEALMLEINTIPGQSNASLVPQQVVASGLSLKEFYSGLIEECFQ